MTVVTVVDVPVGEDDVDDLEDQEDEILRRWYRGEGSNKISADMCIPVLTVREVLHRNNQKTDRPPKPQVFTAAVQPVRKAAPVYSEEPDPAPKLAAAASRLRVYEPNPEPPEFGPNGLVKAATKDVRVETLLAQGDKSRRDRTRRLANRVRAELDQLRVMLAVEENERVAEARLQLAMRELEAARQAIRAAKAKP